MPYKRICGIYKIESITHPERFYIGSAVSIKDRWRWHKKDLRENKHDNPRIQNHYNKYGLEDFIFSIVEICDKDKLIEREQYYFDTLNPWFNILKFAQSPIGHKMPQWLIEKLRKINTGRKDSEETRRRKSESHKGTYGVNNGRKCSDEMKRKNREAHLGEKSHCFGKKQSEETKQKNREAHLGKTPWNKGLTKETSSILKTTGEKISKSLKGRETWCKGKTYNLVNGKAVNIRDKNENINNNPI